MSVISRIRYKDLSKLPEYVWIMLLAGVTTFFISSAVLAYRSVDIITNNNIKINKTLQVINLIKDLNKELVAAESSQRGYLLTGEAEYLEPYHKTLLVVDGFLKVLSESTSETVEQQERLERLESYVRLKIEEMQTIVELTDRDKVKAAINKVKTNEGIELMRAISQLVMEMEQHEFSMFEKNKAKSAHNRFLIVTSLMIANFIGMILSLGIFYIWYKNTIKISSLNRKLTAANAQLEETVQARTQTLIRYSEELQRSNRELEDFAFIASHDLQEPLRKVRAFGDRLQAKCSAELGEVGLDYVARMQLASARMSALIDDLLDFSRVTTQQRPFVKVDLNEVMHRVQENLEFAIEEAGAQITLGSLPVIDADASQIEQVFTNLLANSLKFRRPGTKPEITVTCEVEQKTLLEEDNRDWYSIRFSDNGIGFDEIHAEKIFNLFQRLHSREEYSGTGLGLALCRKIIDRHGGTIRAQSELNKGAVFIIRLPKHN